MRPILSATDTYNYALAKWLDAMLKPLSVNEHTITDIFAFTNEIRRVKINPGEILVSYDVSSLLTNVPLDETIDILALKPFENNWFNDTYDLNLTRTHLVDVLHVATKGQLFQFDGALYEQTDGVAMGSPLGPLLANVFMCSIEGSLKTQGKLPEFYRRYIDDSLVRMPDLAAATQFLDTLNHAHSAVSFTIEVEKNGMLPFLMVQLLNRHHVLKQRFTSSRQTQGYSCTIIAMWTAATSMACSSLCLIVRTGYHHLGRIFQKSVNV